MEIVSIWSLLHVEEDTGSTLTFNLNKTDLNSI